MFVFRVQYYCTGDEICAAISSVCGGVGVQDVRDRARVWLDVPARE